MSDKPQLIWNDRNAKIIHGHSDCGKILLQDLLNYPSDYCKLTAGWHKCGGRMIDVEKDRTAAKHMGSDYHQAACLTHVHQQARDTRTEDTLTCFPLIWMKCSATTASALSSVSNVKNPNPRTRQKTQTLKPNPRMSKTQSLECQKPTAWNAKPKHWNMAATITIQRLTHNTTHL